MWPGGLNAGDDSLAHHFDALNEPWVDSAAGAIFAAQQAHPRRERPAVLTFSHYLPLQVIHEGGLQS